MPQKEAEKAAKSEQIKRATLLRAKAVLGVKSRRSGFGAEGVWYWYLPDTAEENADEETGVVA